MIRDYYDYQDAMRKTLRVPPEKKAVPDVGGIQREYGMSLSQKAAEYEAQKLKEKKDMANLSRSFLSCHSSAMSFFSLSF